MMRKLRVLWRHGRPNISPRGRMAFVALRPDGTPSSAWQPFWALRLFGGRRWSLSVLRLEGIQTEGNAVESARNA